MTLVLPDPLMTLGASARTLADFLHKSGFPDARAVEDLYGVATPEGMVETHDRRRLKIDLFEMVETMIREVHMSPAFDAHAGSRAVQEARLRVPRLRALLVERPPEGPWRDAVVAALARSVEGAPDAAARAALVRLWLLSPAFGALTAGQDGRKDTARALFGAHPQAGLALLEDADALSDMPEALGPLLLAGCTYFSANRSFARCRDLAERALVTMGETDPNAGLAFDQLWYAAFRLGRLEEAAATLARWSARQPILKRPLAFAAIVASVSDQEEAMALLEVSGADLGRSTVGGNVLYAEGLIRRGEARAAERAIRHAIHETAQARRAPSQDYAIALHNALTAQERHGYALSGVFEAHELSLDWEGPLGLDTVVDSSRAPGARGRVAVVMTAWQAEAHLERAMRGVLGQSHEDLELIVMDDCSEDGTREIATRLAREDDRVTVRRTPRNLGTYAAKNIGIRLALEGRAEYVTLCDGDDYWLRPHLAQHIQAMTEAPEAICSTSQWVRVRDDGSIEAGLRGRYVETCPHSTFLRRAAFERAGFFDAVRFGADREFLNRLALHFGAAALVSIPRILTLGRRHDASLTTSGAGAISEFNESPIRLDYWKTWNEWQLAEMAAGRRPVLDGDPDAPRAFPVDPAMRP
jgi:hypothetical protein